MRIRLPNRRWARASDGAAAVAVGLALTSAGCGASDDLILGRDDKSDFVLIRRDDFDELDLSYWERATHTFDPNLAYFTESSATIEQGLLVLSITADPAPVAPVAPEMQKPYSAAEVRTLANFLYGSFRARVRFAQGPGVVSAFWGFYDRFSRSEGPQLDNQIVIESGTPRTPAEPSFRYTVSVPMAENQPALQTAGFEPSLAFHELGYDWTPTEVRFYLDGRVTHVVTGTTASQLRQHQRLVMSAYPSRADWLSDFDPKQLPLRAELDWVEIRAYSGPLP